MLRCYNFAQLLEFFRVKEVNGPATCEQAPVVPVSSNLYVAMIALFNVTYIFCVFSQRADDGWKQGLCAAHGFTSSHGKGQDNGIEVQVDY